MSPAPLAILLASFFAARALAQPAGSIVAKLELHRTQLKEGSAALGAPIPELEALAKLLPAGDARQSAIGAAHFLASSGIEEGRPRLIELLDTIVAQARGGSADHAADPAPAPQSRVGAGQSSAVGRFRDPFDQGAAGGAPPTDPGAKGDAGKSQTAPPELKDAREKLEKFLASGESLMISKAYEAIKRHRSAEHVPLLIEAARRKFTRDDPKKELFWVHRRDAIEALVELRDPRATGALLEIFRDKEADPSPGAINGTRFLRAAALEGLLRLGVPDRKLMEEVAALLKGRSDEEKELRVAVLNGIKAEPLVAESLRRPPGHAEQENSTVLLAALKLAKEQGYRALIPMIVPFLGHPFSGVKTEALDALAGLGGTDSAAAAIAMAEEMLAKSDEDYDKHPHSDRVVLATLELLGKTKDRAHEPFVRKAIRRFGAVNLSVAKKAEESDADLKKRRETLESQARRNDRLRFAAEAALEALGVYPALGREKEDELLKGRGDAIKKAVESLLESQDGAPHTGSWASGPRIAGAGEQKDARTAVTSLVIGALELFLRSGPAAYGFDTKEKLDQVHKAIRLGRGYVDRTAICLPDESWCGLRSFSLGYSLGVLGEERNRETLDDILRRLEKTQQADGGWGYGGGGSQSTSFGMAVIIRGMVDSAGSGRLGEKNEKMLDKAAAALEGARDPLTGLFPYRISAPGKPAEATQAEGDAGRSVVCESALRRYLLYKKAAAKGAQETLYSSLLAAAHFRLNQRIDEFRANQEPQRRLQRSGQQMPHSVRYQLSDYYRLFQLRYFAEAVDDVNHKDKDAIRREVQLSLLSRAQETRTPGQWSDSGYSGPAYGTAMGLRMLLGAGAPAK